MLAFIKANYQIGDSIEVTCSEGLVSGQIEYVNSQFIVLRQPNGQIIGIAASNVKTFTAKSPVKLVPAQGETATQPPVNTEQDDANSNIEFTIETNEAESGNKNSSIVVENAEKADAPTTLRDVLDEKEVPSADELTGADPIAQPKVVGHIDLEHLQRIDPKIKRRSYFKPEETDITNEDVTLTESNDDTPSQPFVKAKGRISFYNTTKRFGFIHDFNSDADLYFYVQQVADHDLYEQLRRGLKVTYSIGQNNKGPMAEVVHLPRVVSEVIDMADAQIKARRYGLAKGLLQHVLEAYPDNREAIDMLDEVKLMAPEEKPVDLRNSLPSTTYAEAKKAYLNKEYDRAEQLYMQAIEAEEKVESSVKDLLTLYVSFFKQATEAERDGIRSKANDFLEAHRHLLSNTLTTKQFLALNYYLPTQNYEAFIRLVDEILSEPQIGGLISRKVFYYWQKSIALNKLGRTDEALALVDEGLKLAPHNRQLNNLRETILHPELAEQPLESQAAEGGDVTEA